MPAKHPASSSGVREMRDQQGLKINDDAHHACLILLYWAWKSLLLIVAVASPGVGYDTSTRILFDRYPASLSASWLARGVQHLTAHLTRWDAVYFVTSSERGHVFEQEWAFSPVFARATSALQRVFSSTVCTSPIACHALAGVVVSHLSHFFAVLLLFKLTEDIVPLQRRGKRQVAFTTACLHILSPAGLFLSASYGESAFAFFTFCGALCYVRANKTPPSGTRSAWKVAILTTCAGVAFGASAMMRGNGLLSGLIFAWDAIAYIPNVTGILGQRAWPQIIRFAGTVIAGSLIGIAYALPQLVAYLEYCTAGNTRPWCERLFPSIYSWVQDRYWGVGFLRYWTLSNLPLFVLATPMLLVLAGTAWVGLSRNQLVGIVHSLTDGKTRLTGTDTAEVSVASTALFVRVMARLALPQLVLAILAMTSFHVQIINRISSGYPVWYVLLAMAIHAGATGPSTKLRNSGRILATLTSRNEWIVRGAVMYAIIQGGLYASFMPPA